MSATLTTARGVNEVQSPSGGRGEKDAFLFPAIAVWEVGIKSAVRRGKPAAGVPTIKYLRGQSL